MATTVQMIRSALVALGFVNDSTEAIYNKVAQGIGIPVDTTVQEFANSEARIQSIISLQRYGRPLYYTTAALAFQYGDNLIADPVTLDPVYAVINPLNQIISQAAFEEIANGNSAQLFLKVATLDQVTGDLQALTGAQLSAFTAYFVNYELPGVPVTIVSNSPNVISFLARASYYKTYDLAKLKDNLKAALTTFRQSFAFDGDFFTGDMEAYIKKSVPGIRDFYAYNTLIDGQPFNGESALTAGYFNYPAPYDTFLNNITYAPV